MRPAVFHAAALAVIRSFPKAARKAMGEAILNLQHGASVGPPLSRPMSGIAPGVQELRVRDATGAYRAFYLVKLNRGVLVFHAFEKRTRKTPRHEMELGRRRLRELLK